MYSTSGDRFFTGRHYVKMLEDMNVGGEAVECQVGRCLDVKQRKRWSKIEADRGCCPVREQISYW
jgi:hypothetical protein